MEKDTNYVRLYEFFRSTIQPINNNLAQSKKLYRCLLPVYHKVVADAYQMGCQHRDLYLFEKEFLIDRYILSCIHAISEIVHYRPNFGKIAIAIKYKAVHLLHILRDIFDEAFQRGAATSDEEL